MKLLNAIIIGVILTITSLSTRADTFQISGSGGTSIRDSHSAFGTSLSYGLSIAKNAEAVLTQGVSYDSGGGSAFSGTTKVGGLFMLGHFAKIIVPTIGIDAGAQYGSNNLNWSVSPNIGARIFLKSDVYVYGKASYDFNLTGRTFTGGDTVSYFLGIGMSF